MPIGCAPLKQRPQGARPDPCGAGFTLIELITVMVIMGVVAAVGAARFFDSAGYEVREFADQGRSLIRYAQKVAIAQNRTVYVRANGASFALCYASACGAGTQVPSPAGSNSGSTVTKAACLINGAYVANWMCEGKPASVTLSSGRANEAGGVNSYFFFDSAGRPYNAGDVAGATSNFTQLALGVNGTGNSYQITIEAETGYVH
jgi:MSHA pilin protein MshC